MQNSYLFDDVKVLKAQRERAIGEKHPGAHYEGIEKKKKGNVDLKEHTGIMKQREKKWWEGGWG